jgi:hypothetical protein
VPVVASMRRWLAPIEPSEVMRMGPMSPVAPHVGAAAQLGRVAPGLEDRAPTSPYLSPKKAMAPSSTASALLVS